MIGIYEHFSEGEKFYEKTVMPVCEKYGITYMEFTVIMFLENHREFDTAKEIVQYRNIAKSHVSTTVHTLDEKGYLTCDHRENDRRTVHLKLTEKAADIIREGKAVQKAFGERLFEGVTPEEKDTYMEVLKKIRNNIEVQAHEKR